MNLTPSNMKSHAAAEGLEVIDWKKVIKDCINGDSAQFKDRKDAMLDWHTCPCGQLPAIITRGDDGTPLDNILETLGKNICGAFTDSEFNSALNILDLIAVRSKYLIKVDAARAKAKIEALKAEIKTIEDQLQ